MTKFYRTIDNKYIGGFDGALPPDGAIEVPSAPKDARSVWNGFFWNEPVITVEEKEVKLGVTLEAKVEALYAKIANDDSTLLDNVKLKLDEAKA